MYVQKINIHNMLRNLKYNKCMFKHKKTKKI